MRRDTKSEVDTVRPPKFSTKYTTAPYLIPIEELDPDDLTPVSLACLVCKGRSRIVAESGGAYSNTHCEWCTNGSMSGEQINRYLNRDVRRRDVDEMLQRYTEK
jgi:hypothetical protein